MGEGETFSKKLAFTSAKKLKNRVWFVFVEEKKRYGSSAEFFSSNKVSVSQFRSTFSSRCLGMGISQSRGESGSIWLGHSAFFKVDMKSYLNIPPGKTNMAVENHNFE